MQDGVIAGTGNSRHLKSVSNFLTLYPTYSDFVAAMVAGTLPIDLLYNAAGWTAEGNALNKAALLKDATAALYGLTSAAVPDDVLAKLAGGVLYQTTSPLSDLSDGDTFYLNESGSPIEFIKLKENYEGSGRTLVLRKDLYDARAWHSSNVNAYATSAIDTWLNTTYFGLLDPDVQEAISAVTIPYTPGNGNNTVSTLSRKVFLLSETEFGFSYAVINEEGTAITYFATDSDRIAYLSDVATSYWSRSPRIDGTTVASGVATGGGYYDTAVSGSIGSRPAFTLPAELAVTTIVPSITDLLGDLITIPSGQLDERVQIEVGSYTGTGTYGSGNPTVITTGFRPKIGVVVDSGYPYMYGVFVYGCTTTCTSTAGTASNVTTTWNATNITYYGADAAQQLNMARTYYYAFLG